MHRISTRRAVAFYSIRLVVEFAAVEHEQLGPSDPSQESHEDALQELYSSSVPVDARGITVKGNP